MVGGKETATTLEVGLGAIKYFHDRGLMPDPDIR